MSPEWKARLKAWADKFAAEHPYHTFTEYLFGDDRKAKKR
jgi:hypothetical protein